MGQVGKEKEMKFPNLKQIVTGEPDIDEYLKQLQLSYLEIQNKIFELIKTEKEKGASSETIEWKVIKLLRIYGVPIKLRDYKRKHKELYQ